MPEYSTPGVYVEEISSGPRPVQASSTTETGIIGMITIPRGFLEVRRTRDLLIPQREDLPILSWQRAVSFYALPGDDEPKALDAKPSDAKPGDLKAGEAKPGEPKTGDPKAGEAKPGEPKAGEPKASTRTEAPRLQRLVKELLGGKWEVRRPDATGAVTLSDGAQTIRFNTRSSLIAERSGQHPYWDLAAGANTLEVVNLVAAHAVELDIPFGGELACVTSSAAREVEIERVHEQLLRTATRITSVDGFDGWLNDFARELFISIYAEVNASVSEAGAETAWLGLDPAAVRAWRAWVRGSPGMRLVEIGVRGFFANGGQGAHLAVGVQGFGAAGPDKAQMLSQAFDGLPQVAMVCAPGLDLPWQKALLDYAGQARRDVFAVMETPRYLLTRAPRQTKLLGNRWSKTGPYECAVLQAMSSPESTELRFSGYAQQEVLDEAVPRDTFGYGAAYGPWVVVENPLSTGAHDRYVVAPPSGHIAGMIAATDLRPGAGVHKAPANETLAGVVDVVTRISDREQGVLNERGINIIRHRPRAGIRVWGARTVASDPLWTYVNVRRLFLFVERSVRDAIQWAVFLPNTQETRNDLRSTIMAFLHRLYMQGMLDGRTWQEAYHVRCDRENNPDADVRAGILTVDIQIRPVFPAEFIRLRFRQSPMQTADVQES